MTGLNKAESPPELRARLASSGSGWLPEAKQGSVRRKEGGKQMLGREPTKSTKGVIWTLAVPFLQANRCCLGTLPNKRFVSSKKKSGAGPVVLWLSSCALLQRPRVCMFGSWAWTYTLLIKPCCSNVPHTK